MGPRAMRVLYEDEDILAVDKPAGVVVIPARDEDPSLALRQRLESARSESLWVVHRIDRETSGVVLFARTASAHRTLNAMFETRAVAKTYVALTAGAPDPAEGEITAALHSARKGKMRPALPDEEGALNARTAYRTLARWDLDERSAVAMIEARPHTGRQHQIRVHLRSLGAPIIADALYGRGASLGDLPLPPRLALHARSIALRWKGIDRVIEAPVPDDLAAFIRDLDTRARRR